VDVVARLDVQPKANERSGSVHDTGWMHNQHTEVAATRREFRKAVDELVLLQFLTCCSYRWGTIWPNGRTLCLTVDLSLMMPRCGECLLELPLASIQ